MQGKKIHTKKRNKMKSKLDPFLLFEKYEKICRTRGNSKGTIKIKRCFLRPQEKGKKTKGFLDFFDSKNVNDSITDFLDHKQKENKGKLSITSLNTTKRIIKEFLDTMEYEYNPKLLKNKPERRKLSPQKLFLKEEFETLKSYSPHSRATCFFSLMHEGGFRPIELVGLQMKHVNERETHWEIVIENSKTTESENRIVHIFDSIQVLKELRNHLPDNPEQHLFYSRFIKSGKHITVRQAERWFDQTKLGAREDGKILNHVLYDLRHTSYTNSAKNMTIALAQKKHGHAIGGNTYKKYLHLVDDDVLKAELQRRGILDENGSKDDEPKKIACPRCSNLVEKKKHCSVCGLLFDEKERDLERMRKEQDKNKIEGLEQEINYLKNAFNDLIKDIRTKDGLYKVRGELDQI